MANVDSPNFRYGKNYNYTNFVIDLIRTPYTLNIFTDVSTRNLTDKLGKQITHSCYGAIGVNMDTIIEESYGLANDCTSEKGEIRGIRKGISLGFKYRNYFPNINIFSDSAYAVSSINEWYYNTWHYNPNKQAIVNSSNNAIKNQSLIIEMMSLLENLRTTNNVNVYHISGHIDNDQKDIKRATTKFRNINRIKGNLDYNVIRYAVMYNNYIDNHTRSIVRTTDFINNNYGDIVEFDPINYIS